MGDAPRESPVTDRAPPGPRAVLWWPYAVLRTAGCWVLLALMTTVCAAVYIPAAAVAPGGRLARGIERFWAWFILRGSNVRLTARGLDLIEPGESYIVMANHRSMYDIPVLHYLLGRGRDLRWIGKQELLKVPVFGWVFGVSRHIAIDRRNRGRAIAALKSAAAGSATGVSFVIMPEGTRSVDGRLAPFKKGGFHLAIDTGLPILPVTILDSERLMRKGEWWILHGAIEVVVSPAIEAADEDRSRLDALVERVREEIEAILSGWPEETERSAR